MAKQANTEYDKAVSEFIRTNKTKGQVVYDELSNTLATPFSLDADAMDKLIQKSRMPA